MPVRFHQHNKEEERSLRGTVEKIAWGGGRSEHPATGEPENAGGIMGENLDKRKMKGAEEGGRVT